MPHPKMDSDIHPMDITRFYDDMGRACFRITVILYSQIDIWHHISNLSVSMVVPFHNHNNHTDRFYRQ
jgi:hypothetical protein